MILTASFTTFLGNTRFNDPIRIWFKKLCAQSLHIQGDDCQEPKFSDPESGHATHEIKAAIQLLLASV